MALAAAPRVAQVMPRFAVGALDQQPWIQPGGMQLSGKVTHAPVAGSCAFVWTAAQALTHQPEHTARVLFGSSTQVSASAGKRHSSSTAHSLLSRQKEDELVSVTQVHQQLPVESAGFCAHSSSSVAHRCP